MKIETAKDYKKYIESKSRSELQQILISINRSKLRTRYEMVAARLAALPPDVPNPVKPAPTPLKEPVLKSVGDKRSWLQRILLVLFSLMMGTVAFGTVFGTLWARGESKTPWTFFEGLTLFLFLTLPIVSGLAIFLQYNRITATALSSFAFALALPWLQMQDILYIGWATISLLGIVLIAFWPEIQKGWKINKES